MDAPHRNPPRTIRISRKIRGIREETEVLLHEILHAASWQSDEEWVTLTALTLTDALFRSGLVGETT